MTASTGNAPGLRYYEGEDLLEGVLEALRNAGLDVDRLDVDDLALLDEFHALGRPATIALAELAGVQPSSRVLDVGAGIGGPARVLAARYEAYVTALDGTPRFCRACERLCRATGLDDRVTVTCGDALELPFEDARFDLVWTQALSQNVEDKARMYAEMARVLEPGGRLATFDVVTGPGGGSLHYPLPWADGPAESFVVPPAELRRLIVDAGFEPAVWNEGPAALAEIQRAGAELDPGNGVPGLELGLLMPDFEARMKGLARDVSEERIGLVQAVLKKS